MKFYIKHAVLLPCDELLLMRGNKNTNITPVDKQYDN
jgi:hypothetical protein